MMKTTHGNVWAVFIMALAVIALSTWAAGTVVAFDGGDGSADDPYQISNWNDLADVNDDPTAHYVLTENLDRNTDGYDAVASEKANNGSGWEPLGPDGSRFSGTFDGQNHSVRGLYIDRPNEKRIGLFGYIEDGVVRNVGVTDVDLTGDNKLGAVAGRNTGTIATSYSTGVVDGSERTGGLVGHNENGLITNSYSRAEVSSDHEKIGGLVGDNSNSEIYSSYSAGIVDKAGDGSTVGGLTGREDGDTIVKDSFWDTVTSDQTSSGGGTGKTTSEMNEVATFTDEGVTEGLSAAWDFVDNPNDDITSGDIWDISSSINDGYPYLTDQAPPYIDIELNAPGDGDTGTSVPSEMNVTATSAEGNNINVSLYSMTGWNIETASYDRIEVDTEDTGPEGLHISADGTTMYVMGYSDEEVYQFSLSTPWDLSTAAFQQSQPNVDANSADLFVSPDGGNYYELEKADGEIHWMDMDGGDIDTVDTADRTTIETQSSDPEDIHFSPDGTKLYELSNSDIYEYDLSTAWDLSTATFTGKSISSQDSASTGLFIHPNGTQVYEVGDGDDRLHQFTLSTAWDLSTATADDVSTDLEHGDAHSLFFKPTGTQLYYVGRDAERAYSYSLDATPELIDTTSDVNSGTDVAYTWDTVDSLRYYEWLVTADDGSVDYTSSTWNFTTDDVTLIESWSQLNDIRNDPSGSYVLSNNLNKHSDGYDTYGSDWDAIGTFEGNFDGQGHTIAELTGNNGLFSEIDGATIENVTLNDVDIGSTYNGIGSLVGEVDSTEKSTIFEVRVTGDVHGEIGTGGLIGVNNYADVGNSSFSGTITSEGKNTGGLVGYETGGNDYTNVYTEGNIGEGEDAVEENNVGGLIGFFDSVGSGGSVTDSYANTTVSAEGDSGGLIGRNLGADVTDSYARGNIAFSEGPNTGGLVGYDGGDNTYTRVYAAGNIEESHEENNAGGLIGHFGSGSGSIMDSYATGDVDGDNLVGGLIGKNDGASVYSSYSVGKVTASGEAGGLIGSDDGGSYSNSFWDNETSGQDSTAGGTGLTTAQMQDYSSFTDESNSLLDAAWDFVGTENDDAGTDEYWEMDQDGAVNDDYPILTWQDGADGVLTSSDSLSVSISTPDDGDTTQSQESIEGSASGDNDVKSVNLTIENDDNDTWDDAEHSFTTTDTTVQADYEDTDETWSYDSSNITSAGTYNVTAVVSDSGGNTADSDTVTHTISAADADSVSVETQPEETTAGETIETPPTANVTDSSGNPVVGVDVAVTLNTSDFAPGSTTTVQTDASGVATFNDLVVNTTGDYELNFSISSGDDNVTADASASSQTFEVEAAGTNTVSVTGDTTTATADGTSELQYTATVEDEFGNPVEGVTVNATDNGTDLTYTGDGPSVTTASDGDATFTVTSPTAQTVEFTFTEQANGNENTATGTFEDAGADSVAIQTEPQETTAGETLTGPPEVIVTDEDENAVEGVDVTVTEDGDYSFDSGTTTQTTGSDGVATFDDLVINTADTGYQLDFSIDTADDNVDSDDTANSQTFEVESAIADSITIQTEPEATQTANETLTGLPAVNVTDEHSNAVEGVDVTVALNSGGDPKNFDSKSTLTVLTNRSGIATFDNLVVNTATGDYWLEFSVNPSVTSEIFSMEAAADTTPPEITDFSVDNTEGQTVEVSFDSNEEINAIAVSGTDDADGTTLGNNDFTQSGNITSDFTYTATLSENKDGTFGATFDIAEDTNGNNGASGESDSVMIDTINSGDGSSGGSGGDGSSGGSGGDGSSGGSGGDGSSGGSGGDGSSGGGAISGSGGSNNEDAETDQPQPVTRHPSDDGSVGFTVSDSSGAGGIALSVTDEADDPTEGPTGRNVDQDSLSVQPTEAGTREFNISVRQWDASSETNESTNDRFFEGTGSSAIGYVEVTHSNSDDDIEGVTFQFRVQSAYLDEHDIESKDIALYRDEASGWNELDATEVETTDTHHVFEAESPGLSLFAVGAPDSAGPANGPEAVATVSPDSVAEGEEVTLDASGSTDDDGEIVAYEWSVDGETLTGETVTLTVEEAGKYTVELKIANDAGETDITSTDMTVTEVGHSPAGGASNIDEKMSISTENEPSAGFAIYVIIALFVTMAAVVLGVAMTRRRVKDDDPL